MNRSSILDFLGVARAIGLATAIIGLVIAAVLLGSMFAGISGGWTGTALAAWFGVFVVFPGLLVVCVASLSRVFIRRMRLRSEPPTP